MKDLMTGEELTPQNAMRCFDGYLEAIREIDGDMIIFLMFYFDYALSVNDSDLLSFMVGRVIQSMKDYQYTFEGSPRIP